MMICVMYLEGSQDRRAECSKEGTVGRRPEGMWDRICERSAASSFSVYCVEQESIWSILPGRKNICNQNIFKEKVKFCFEEKKTELAEAGPLYESYEAPQYAGDHRWWG